MKRRLLKDTISIAHLADVEPIWSIVHPFLDNGARGSGERPGGFSTILFTDVVSSTALLTQLKDQRMRAVIRDHAAVCDAAITEHGRRVVNAIPIRPHA